MAAKRGPYVAATGSTRCSRSAARLLRFQLTSSRLPASPISGWDAARYVNSSGRPEVGAATSGPVDRHGPCGAAELHDVHADGPEVEDTGPGAPHAGDEDVDDAAVRAAGHDAARRPPEVLRARDRQPSGAGPADEVDAPARLHERAVVLETRA